MHVPAESSELGVSDRRIKYILHILIASEATLWDADTWVGEVMPRSPEERSIATRKRKSVRRFVFSLELCPTRGIWDVSPAHPSHASCDLRDMCVGRPLYKGLGRASGPLVATSVSPAVLVAIVVAHALGGVPFAALIARPREMGRSRSPYGLLIGPSVGPSIVDTLTSSSDQINPHNITT